MSTLWAGGLEEGLAFHFGAEPAGRKKIPPFEKFLWCEKPIVIAFRVCDPFGRLDGGSRSREESEVWRVEEL
jgi:hypothetical protein